MSRTGGPGHTPGHSSLHVRLKSGKNFLLSGDAAHFHENYESNGVPIFNYDRAQTVDEPAGPERAGGR